MNNPVGNPDLFPKLFLSEPGSPPQSRQSFSEIFNCWFSFHAGHCNTLVKKA
jgi:hypothetical protein